MFFKLLPIFIFVTSAFAQEIPSCESAKVSFTTTQKVQVHSEKGKLLKSKEEHYPLMEDWSEASGEIVALTIKGTAVDKVKAFYFGQDKKLLIENEFKVEKNKLVKFEWAKMVKGKETRQGELRFQPMTKENKVLCQQNVNIHYADQLDR